MVRCKSESGLCHKQKDICCSMCNELSECNRYCVDANPYECSLAESDGVTDELVFADKSVVVFKQIKEAIEQRKVFAEEEKRLKEVIKTLMEDYNIKEFESSGVRAVYMEEFVRTSVDSKKVKDKYPEIAMKCVKEQVVAPFVKVEVRGE